MNRGIKVTSEKRCVQRLYPYIRGKMEFPDGYSSALSELNYERKHGDISRAYISLIKGNYDMHSKMHEDYPEHISDDQTYFLEVTEPLKEFF